MKGKPCTLPDTTEGQPDNKEKEVGAAPEHKQPVTADEVTAFNDILYNTKVSRNLLFYNPNIFQSLVYAQVAKQGVDYLEQEKKIDPLIQKRKDLLKKNSTQFQPRFWKNDLVFLTHWTKLPIHDSNELSPVANSMHFVIEPGPTSSKIAHVFNGTTRKVPNEKLWLIHWTDMASMRTALRDHQQADLSAELLRSNRFLSADQSKTRDPS